MADIYPFRGITFRNEKVGPLDKVVSQPYDKITPQMKVRYLEQSAFNIARVILPAASGTTSEEPYLEAAGCFNGWLETGILDRSPGPCLYPYHQTFPIPGTDTKATRKGFIALGQLYDYSAGVVRPHEHTHSGPKIDRLMLTRATGCQFGLLFMLYQDPGSAVNELIDSQIQDKEPFTSVRDEYGVTHSVWIVPDGEPVRQMQRLMRDKKLYIADGHHRYETALTYWREQAELGVPSTGNEAIDRAMMAFVSVEDSGLVILPTHRVLFSLPEFSSPKLLGELENHFKVTPRGTADQKTLKKTLREISGSRKIFLFTSRESDKLYSLELNREADLNLLVKSQLSDHWKSLDVNILHKLIFESCLGINEKELTRQEKVVYLRDPLEALDMVQDPTSKYQAAFFLNPPQVQDVVEVADRGECMPQKSTDFYPKMLTGLVINRINR